MIYWITRFLLIVLFKILFRLKAYGVDNIPGTGAFILASNHTSYLDPIILACSIKRRLNFMARDDLFKIPFFGFLIRCLGAFSVRRNYADISSIREALKLLKQSEGLVIFPEGARSQEELVNSVEPGIGFVARKAGVPVVPVYIKGAKEAWGRQSKYIRLVHISAYFAKPLYFDRLKSKEDNEHITTIIKEEINRLIKKEGGVYK